MISIENSIKHSSSITCIEKIPSANTKFAFGSNDGEIRHLKLDISESDDPRLIIGDQVVENSPNKVESHKYFLEILMEMEILNLEYYVRITVYKYGN